MTSRIQITIAILLSGCATNVSARSDVFSRPANYLEHPVSICGYMIDSANIFEGRTRRARQRLGGLSILARGPLDLRYRGRLCVDGHIEYMGCETSQTVICTDAVFDYGIRITRITEIRH